MNLRLCILSTPSAIPSTTRVRVDTAVCVGPHASVGYNVRHSVYRVVQRAKSHVLARARVLLWSASRGR